MWVEHTMSLGLKRGVKTFLNESFHWQSRGGREVDKRILVRDAQTIVQRHRLRFIVH